MRSSHQERGSSLTQPKDHAMKTWHCPRWGPTTERVSLTRKFPWRLEKLEDSFHMVFDDYDSRSRPDPGNNEKLPRKWTVSPRTRDRGFVKISSAGDNGDNIALQSATEHECISKSTMDISFTLVFTFVCLKLASLYHMLYLSTMWARTTVRLWCDRFDITHSNALFHTSTSTHQSLPRSS